MTIFLPSFSYGQNVTELYNQKNFQELIKLDGKTDNLTADELYMVGFAFFQTENDSKAIEIYDKAISKGLNNGSVHFYKGLSLRLLNNYEEALKEIEKSLKLEPTNQEFMNEKGMVYYSQKNFDKALEVFEIAKKLPNTFPEPYYWIARIYHEKEDFKKALTAYYDAEQNLPKDNSNYFTTIMTIGQLEYTLTKDFKKSIISYEKAIQLDKQNFEIYFKLIKSCNADKDFIKADSLFQILKQAYKNKTLPKNEMEFKTVSIAQFQWNGQNATILKSLENAKETLDITYKVFVQNKQGDKVERRFVVEKTFQIEKDGANFLLCEQDKKTGGHITYPYGWKEENITAEDLEKAVKLVLDGKMKQGASSNFNKN